MRRAVFPVLVLVPLIGLFGCGDSSGRNPKDRQVVQPDPKPGEPLTPNNTGKKTDEPQLTPPEKYLEGLTTGADTPQEKVSLVRTMPYPLPGGNPRGLVARATRLVFSSNSRVLASVDGGILKLWDVQKASQLDTELEHFDGMVVNIAFTPDSKALLLSSTKGMQLRHIGGRLLHTFSEAAKSTVAVACSADGKYLAAGDETGTVRVWDGKTRELLRTLTGHPKTVLRLTFAPNSLTLASLADTEKVQLWDTQFGTLKRTIEGGAGVDDIVFSPDGKQLAGGGRTGVTLWEVETGKVSRSLPNTDLSSSTTTVAFSSDGKTLADGTENGILRVWNLPALEARVVDNGPEGGLLNRGHVLALSPDGKTLASAAGDRTIKLIDMAQLMEKPAGLKIKSPQ